MPDAPPRPGPCSPHTAPAAIEDLRARLCGTRWPDSFWRYTKVIPLLTDDHPTGLGIDHPDRVIAVHRTDAGVPVFTGDRADLAPAERARLDDAAAWGATEGGPELYADELRAFFRPFRAAATS